MTTATVNGNSQRVRQQSQSSRNESDRTEAAWHACVPRTLACLRAQDIGMHACPGHCLDQEAFLLPLTGTAVIVLSRFSGVQLHAILWTAARQAPQSVGFSRQEY